MHFLMYCTLIHILLNNKMMRWISVLYLAFACIICVCIWKQCLHIIAHVNIWKTHVIFAHAISCAFSVRDGHHCVFSSIHIYLKLNTFRGDVFDVFGFEYTNTLCRPELQASWNWCVDLWMPRSTGSREQTVVLTVANLIGSMLFYIPITLLISTTSCRA